ncbi:MAG: ferritin family protein [Dehalococcoidales bacterium]
MVTEQNKTLNALKIAIQMEIDGKEFYLKASKESSNELGEKLLEKLAAEEDIHLQKFEEIYDAIRSKKAWPKTDYQPNRGRGLRTVFAKAMEETGSSVKAPATELDAIQTAMDMENETYDFYKAQGKIAVFAAEREFYEALAIQEKEHHLILLDYYEFLKNPAAWFVSKEHPSLDAG